MHDAHARALTGAAALVVIWIVVYWLWQPGPSRVLAVPEPPRPTATSLSHALDEISGENDRIIDPLIDRAPAPAPAPAPTPAPSLSAERLVAQPPDQPQQPEGVVPLSGVVPPRFRDHAIRPGETLQSIARDAYGSSALWTVVARANPSVDPNKLRAGRVIRLPIDPSNIQGQPVADAPAATPLPARATIEYRVRSGDALSKIAARFYGSSRYTDFLYEANKDRLRDKASIRVGQVLLIPPKPAD